VVVADSIERTQARIERIRVDPQFGCAGRHYGSGTPECPIHLHHHHDWYCQLPTLNEWWAAGKTGQPHWGSRG
jgi:hypothetical protein